MLKLIFARDTNNHFILADYNDEKLMVIGEILLNSAVRKSLKKLLEGFEYLEISYHALPGGHGPLQYFALKESEHIIRIRRFDQGLPLQASNPLEIELNTNILSDLIHEWEELATTTSEPQIMLTRSGDTYTFTDKPLVH